MPRPVLSGSTKNHNPLRKGEPAFTSACSFSGASQGFLGFFQTGGTPTGAEDGAAPAGGLGGRGEGGGGTFLHEKGPPFVLAPRGLEQNTFRCLFTNRGERGIPGAESVPLFSYHFCRLLPRPGAGGDPGGLGAEWSCEVAFLSGGTAGLCVFLCLWVSVCAALGSFVSRGRCQGVNTFALPFSSVTGLRALVNSATAGTFNIPRPTSGLALCRRGLLPTHPPFFFLLLHDGQEGCKGK